MDAHSKPPRGFSESPLPTGGMQSGYANMPQTRAPGWFGTIAWDALLNGMATGLFMAAAVCELAAPAIFVPVSKVAYPIALLLLLVDLGMLVLDLGDPLRFHHMLRTFKPGSPMSVGTWCLSIFSLPLTAAAALSVLSAIGWDFEQARVLAVVFGLLPAFGSAAYKGVLLSTNAQPGWKDARWMGGYLTNSALLMGCVELLLLSAVMEQSRATDILRSASIVLLVLNVIPLALLLRDLHPTQSRLYTRPEQWLAGLVIFVAGMLVPLGLLLLNGGLLSTLGAVILVWFENWFVRFLYVKIPHSSPLHVRSGSD